MIPVETVEAVVLILYRNDYRSLKEARLMLERALEQAKRETFAQTLGYESDADLVAKSDATLRRMRASDGSILVEGEQDVGVLVVGRLPGRERLRQVQCSEPVHVCASYRVRAPGR